ncbi:MAG: Crp/Fnr family transcriptional regulator [Pseudazoarcus pumilus]|nr:Crp/Fnr family transcriptional regulator [Pseudazoarcus pumilus]
MLSAVSTVALKTFTLFQGLPDEVLVKVAAVSGMRRYPRGHHVLDAGDEGDHVYFVLTGAAKVVVSGEGGRDAILGLLGRGAVFGEMAMFGGRPRSASVVTAEPSDLVQISVGDFRRLMQENFELAWRVMCLLADRLREADRKIESLALRDVHSRVEELLREMAQPCPEGSFVATRITKQDIARMVGASREMVSRVMRDLSRGGIVEERPDGILLKDRPAGEAD